jgi:hypothetical protein
VRAKRWALLKPENTPKVVGSVLETVGINHQRAFFTIKNGTIAINNCKITTKNGARTVDNGDFPMII